MLSFLRKIRRSLIESDSTKKYILYAIGEIALVVIGILIALQINNWNDKSRDEEFFIEMLQEIKLDLQRDTFRFRRATIAAQRSIQVKTWGLNKTEFKISDADSIADFIRPAVFAFEITDDGFRRLVNTGIMVPKEYEDLFKELDVLYHGRKNGHDELLLRNEEESSLYTQYLVNQSDFEIELKNDILTLQDPLERFKNLQAFLFDPKTRNHLKLQYIRKKDLLEQFEEIDNVSTGLLKKINQVLKE